MAHKLNKEDFPEFNFKSLLEPKDNNNTLFHVSSAADVVEDIWKLAIKTESKGLSELVKALDNDEHQGFIEYHSTSKEDKKLSLTS